MPSVLDRSALEQSPLADLHLLANELGVDGFRRLRKPDLVEAILTRQGGVAESAPEPEPEEQPQAQERPARPERPEAEGDEGSRRSRRGRRGGRGRRRDEEEGGMVDRDEPVATPSAGASSADER